MGLPTTGAAYTSFLPNKIEDFAIWTDRTLRNKRYSRWKAKAQATTTNGASAAAEGAGSGSAEDGGASPVKTKAIPKKKTAGAENKAGTPRKTPVEKTPSKKRKLEEDADGEEEGPVKAEPGDEGEVSISLP